MDKAWLSRIVTLASYLATATASTHHSRQNPYTNDTAANHVIYQYAPVAWVENLAVRPNGWLLPILSLGTSPLLNQLDPATGELRLVHDFSSAGNCIQGITEVLPDLFVVDALTCNTTALTCTQGSVSAWTVDFRNSGHSFRHQAVPRVRKVADFPKAGFLNGMATLDPHAGLVLIADSFKGGIWLLNIWTGATSLLFTDLSMSAHVADSTGINGIRVRHGELYFTNSALATFNRIPIDPHTGMKTGNATVIASGLSGPDDFEVDLRRGVAYVCNGIADELLGIPLGGGQVDLVASLTGPTSARWADGSGIEGPKLYVSTVGNEPQYVENNVTVGGAVYEVEV